MPARYTAHVCVLGLASCLFAMHSARIDPARFAAHADWTPAHYSLPPDGLRAADPRATISRDDAIEDVAYLDHMLAEAWPDADRAEGQMVRDRARDVPLHARTNGALCDGLAAQSRYSTLRVSIAGHACGQRPLPLPPEPIADIPADRNYSFRIDHGANGGEVAVLAISNFADPSDPGWSGFDDALRDLTTRDVILLDMQGAVGDDPRMGFALLAALGREDGKFLGWRRPAANDGPYAQVARANFAAHSPSAKQPRSRALWGTFGSASDPAAIARTLSSSTRATGERVTMLDVLVGSGCESACGLIATIAKFAAPQSNVDVLGETASDFRADELGLVRLPHSGVDVTFPTVEYGAGMEAPDLSGAHASGFASDALAKLRIVADDLAIEHAFEAQPLPNCETLTRLDDAVRKKTGGCPPSDATTGNVEASVELALDEIHARTFLETCGDLEISITLPVALHGKTLAVVTAPRGVFDRITSAPFVRSVGWNCSDDLKYAPW